MTAPVPGWLTDLAANAVDHPVPAPLRPPAGRGRRAAVLLLFGESAEGPDVLLIQRSAKGRNHAGQPAFPGGGVDPDDGGPVRAALREAEEETGLDPAGVQVVGALPELYIWRSDNRVTPVLGWWHTPSAVHAASPDEVDVGGARPDRRTGRPRQPAETAIPRWPRRRAGVPGARHARVGLHGRRAQ